jgi:hypothetical protein
VTAWLLAGVKAQTGRNHNYPASTRMEEERGKKSMLIYGRVGVVEALEEGAV